MAFCVWHLSLSIMSLRSIHIVNYISTLFIFMPEWYSIVWMNHILFIHSFGDGCLDCAHSSAVKSIAATSMHVQAFVWTYDFISLGQIPRSRIARLCEKFMMNCLRNCRTVFQGGWLYHLQSHQQCMSAFHTHTSPQRLHFLKKETQVQRWELTCLRSHG